MASAIVGSVTANLILETGEFTTALNTAKGEINALKESFGSFNVDAVTKRIAELETKLNNNNTVIQRHQETIRNLESEIAKLSNGLTKGGESVSKNGQNFDKATASLDKYSSALNTASEAQTRFVGSANIGQKVTAEVNQLAQAQAKANTALSQLRADFSSFQLLYDGFFATRPKNTWVNDVVNYSTTVSTHVKKIRGELVQWEESLKSASASLYRFHEDFYKLSDLAKAGQWFEQIGAGAVKSGEEIAQMEKKIMGIENTLPPVEKAREAFRKLGADVDSLYAKMNKWKATPQSISAGGTINNASGQYARQRAELDRLSASMEKTSASARKLSSSTTSASARMNAMGSATTMLQSKLSSLKMVATAVSSMFVWTFGMSLYEATKQTLQSKNEMESYLTQMGLGRGAINLFNQGLDETADRFKKLNKYMIGETIAGIGMEFDLTANQMKESMEVVAMIQNEYVRAGRKESEATLAVKDILQGEFLRLSRETGVGKQDLIDTGLWSGDLKDVVGIMEALKQIGTDRHWDLFAEKCISLNDVISETKNRVSEFGAMLADQFSPIIVGVFNHLVSVIDSLTGMWNSFDPFQRIAVGVPIVLAFGTALMMVAGNLGLVDIAQMGYGASLMTTILKLDVATVKEHGLATAIVSKITAVEADTVAELGNTKALLARILGLDTAIASEHGLSGALALSASVKGEDTIATNLNSLAKDLNASNNLLNATAVGEFTVVEGFATAQLAENTTATELNTIIKELNAKANLSAFQSIVVFVTGLKAEEVQAMSTNEALLALLGTMTAMEAIAVIAVVAGIAVALGSLAMEAQRAKEAVDGFYDIVDNGDDYVKNAQESVEGYTKQVQELEQALADAKASGKDTFNIEQNLNTAKANLDVANQNLKDIQNVNDLAKQSAEEFGEQINMANTDFARKNSEIFKKLGKDGKEATEIASSYTNKYLRGVDQMRTAIHNYTQALDDGADHIDTNVDALKEMGASQETLVGYAKDYGEEVMKNAEYQKDWAEGDFWAIFKIGLSDLKLAWIDFTYWIGEQQWWKDFCNALGEAKHAFEEFYHAIEPAIPVIGQVLQFIGSVLWQHFVTLCYAIYEVVKIVYPYFKEWAGVTYENFKQCADYLEDIYNFLVALNDLRNGDGKKLEEWLANMTGKNNNINTGIDADGNFDMNTYLGGIADSVMNSTNLSSLIPGGMVLDWFLPMPSLADIDTWCDNFMNTITTSFSNLFSGGGEKNRGSMGVAKSVPSDNLFMQMLGLDNPEQLGSDIANGLWNGLVTGLSNTPIIGGIMDWLNLTDSAQGTASEKGSGLGQAFGIAFENWVRGIPVVGDIYNMLNPIDSTVPTAKGKGHMVGQGVHDGVDEGKSGTASLVNSEMDEVISSIASHVGSAYSTAQQVGSSILNGINSMLDHHSPGAVARLVGAEMDEVGYALSNAVSTIYSKAQEVGNAITTGFQPTTDVSVNTDGLGNFQQDSALAMSLATQTVTTTEGAFNELDMNTGLTFANIGSTIGTTMTNIATNTKTNYNNIVTTTKSQLGNMQSETTKNINQIKTSWNGMQTALIASAENIRSETSSKIHSLQNNMATFWRKVQNPALLLGGSAGDGRTRLGKQRFSSGGSPVRKVLSSKPHIPSHIHGAGANPYGARSGTGISDKIRYPTTGNTKQLDLLAQYLECLENGGNCYAGGWNFNWSPDIKRALLTWHTHFGAVYDPYLTVGKFENDNFPVRGIAPIAKNYIYDAISRTTYEGYFDSKYGSPLEAWNAGHFNCYDGALLVMALASAFGFTNSHMVHGSWDGVPHVWAYIEGLGEIDATAIQGGYGLTASKTGASANQVAVMNNRNRARGAGMGVPVGDTTNFNGDIHIHIDGSDKDSEEIAQEVRHSILDLMSPNPSTGL